MGLIILSILGYIFIAALLLFIMNKIKSIHNDLLTRAFITALIIVWPIGILIVLGLLIIFTPYSIFEYLFNK